MSQQDDFVKEFCSNGCCISKFWARHLDVIEPLKAQHGHNSVYMAEHCTTTREGQHHFYHLGQLHTVHCTLFCGWLCDFPKRQSYCNSLEGQKAGEFFVHELWSHWNRYCFSSTERWQPCWRGCPIVSKRYTTYMSGVDRADQLRMQCATCRKAVKWWKYICWFLFDMAVCNAFICMRESDSHQLVSRRGRVKLRTQIDFRLAISDPCVNGSRHQLLI